MTRPAPFAFALLLLFQGLAAAGGLDDVVRDLRHADRETRRAAQREVARIAHEASGPGRAGAARERCSRALLTALESRPRLPRGSADAVLRALARTVDGDASIERLARLADDPVLGDRVTATLAAVPHPRAVRALVDRIPEPRALVALASHAERLEDGAVGALLGVAAAGDPDARAAARRVLARSGHPAARRLLTLAVERGGPDVRGTATDDLLRWAERTPDRGAAAAALRPLLGAPAPHHRTTAVLALGRCGEGGDLLALAGRLGDESSRVRGAAREALVGHPHPGADDVLRGLYDDPAAPHRPALLAILARRAPDGARGRVLAALDAGDDALRRTALERAGALDDPALPDRLLSIAVSTNGPTRDAALGAVLEHARRRGLEGDEAGARRLLHRALDAGGAAAVRREALVLLAAVADATSLDAVARLDADEEVREEVARVRLAVGRRLADRGDPHARDLLDEVVLGSRDRDRRGAALDALAGLGVDVSRYAKRAGFLTDWHVAGPFPEATADDLGAAAFPLAPLDLDAAWDGKDGPVRWREHATHDPDGLLDLGVLIGGEHAAAYATAEFTADGGPGRLSIGSDDGVAVWLNGELVHDHFVWRGVRPDEDVVEVRFAPGVNRLVAKVSNGGGAWGLCVRVTDSGGRPIDLRAAEF